jgi:hypothetical protein
LLRALISSSDRPSLKYSSSGLGLRLTNGRTATDRSSDAAGCRVATTRGHVMDAERTSSRSSVTESGVSLRIDDITAGALFPLKGF